jgi:transcriptional regulator with XRE-family HTH domain
MNINESPDPRSSMWSWMAQQLRFQRMQRGLTGDALAKILNVARSSISRLENGDAKLTEKQAAILDEEWNTGGLFSVMLWYARQGHDPTWFRSFTEFEARALWMKIYSGQLIPALFQTPAYARALFAQGRAPDLDKAVEDRMSRQSILTRQNPPDMWVLLAETTLVCEVGGREAMREQLAKLLEISELPTVYLRVVPNSAGANHGLDGPFKIIKVKEGQVGYVDASHGGRLVADPAEVERFAVKFDQIGTVALPVDASRALIKQLMETMT